MTKKGKAWTHASSLTSIYMTQLKHHKRQSQNGPETDVETESPEVNLWEHSQLIHKKGAKNIHPGKDIPQYDNARKNEQHTQNNLDTMLYHRLKWPKKATKFQHQALTVLGPLKTDTLIISHPQESFPQFSLHLYLQLHHLLQVVLGRPDSH